MKILHIENCASVPYYIALGQRKLGHDVTVLETAVVPQNYGEDLTLAMNGSIIHKGLNALKIIKLAKDFDIVHFHQGIRPERWDKRYICKRQPYVIHYHGSETRLGTGMVNSDKVKEKIINTPDLFKWHPKANFILNPFDPSGLKESFEDTDEPIIMHLPTNRFLKGTDIILEAMEHLRNKGAKFRFQLVENVPRSEALARMESAHIVIDQMNLEERTNIPGLFGMVSLEAMSMGKVVISSFEPKMRNCYPKTNPLISCPPDAKILATLLNLLLDDFVHLKWVASKGRKYVETYHSPTMIAQEHLEVYERVLQ